MSAAGRSDGRTVGRWLRVLCALSALCVLPAPLPLSAQQPPPTTPEEGRRRIEAIRAERERLQREQARLQGQVQDVGTELRNLERQRDVTNQLVNEIERQLGGLGDQLERVGAELVLAQDNLAERQAVLERRLVDIYKRGPLHTWQVLLAAESFGDLLARYKYLYLTSVQDRALLTDVARLNERITRQRGQLREVQGQLDNRRTEREAELRRYASLAAEREGRLRRLRQTTRETGERLSALERDEARLNELLVALERRRTAGGAAAAPRAGGGLTTADIGRLDWPVEGRILYRFGRDTLPSGGVIRWNGIGIGAEAGTAVRAVEGGRVALVQRLSTYGLTVVVEHGNGYYSLYMQLQSASVQVGQAIERGALVGTVGGANTDYGAHLHFEIRGENQIALDPMDWLRRRR